MEFLTIATISILIIMGAFHFYWAFDGKLGLDKALPTEDGKRLINPGKVLTLIVGVTLVGFSFIAYSLQFDNSNSNYIIYLGWIISGIFIIRAIGEFNAVGFFKKIKLTEFAKYDTKYFSPLCLCLGLVFAVLSYQA